MQFTFAARLTFINFPFAFAAKPGKMCPIEVKHAKSPMSTPCKHPKVRIVSRHEDSEFVECLECGEVFDSEEFRDMEIEESSSGEQDEEPEE